MPDQLEEKLKEDLAAVVAGLRDLLEGKLVIKMTENAHFYGKKYKVVRAEDA